MVVAVYHDSIVVKVFIFGWRRALSMEPAFAVTSARHLLVTISMPQCGEMLTELGAALLC